MRFFGHGRYPDVSPIQPRRTEEELSIEGCAVQPDDGFHRFVTIVIVCVVVLFVVAILGGMYLVMVPDRTP